MPIPTWLARHLETTNGAPVGARNARPLLCPRDTPTSPGSKPVAAWENETSEAAQGGNPERPLTHSLDCTEEGLAMKATRTCSIDDCPKPVKARGWCAMHYWRWSHNGDPLVSRKKLRPTCSHPDCDRPHYGLGWCELHWQRFKHNGDPDIVQGYAERPKRPRSERLISSHGYVILYIDGHPLAGSHSQVYEHQVVLYASIGPGEHPCHWCGRAVRWQAGTWRGCLVVDHVDHDKQNNNPANLVPSCNPCNIKRAAA